ncbi:HSP20-like chaperone [Tribonema minus]|uniref:HSP20-like chaperone n=1 Tax=Tribonema minus TaxID=303371 RepID=A0A836CCV6_9STRA|nr:HSP20-like chaperone [Tribonema minus]
MSFLPAVGRTLVEDTCLPQAVAVGLNRNWRNWLRQARQMSSHRDSDRQQQHHAGATAATSTSAQLEAMEHAGLPPVFYGLQTFAEGMQKLLQGLDTEVLQPAGLGALSPANVLRGLAHGGTASPATSAEGMPPRGALPLHADVIVDELAHTCEVRIDVPGVPREALRATVNDARRELSVIVDRRRDAQGTEPTEWVLQERPYGRTRRRIRLPESVDTKNAQTELKDGVLRIHMSMQEHTRTRQLEIEDLPVSPV